MTTIAVYGASGFTGRLVVAELRRRGVRAVLVGRDEGRLRRAAEATTDAEVRAAGIDEPAALAAAFDGCAAVVNCVAPFGSFGEPVLRAALAAGCHYVDTTGEQPYLRRVFETCGEAAERAGVTAVPALADDGGPGDLIAHLTAGALGRGRAVESLTIADLRLPGAVSRGTGRTALANPRLWRGDGGLHWADGAWHPGTVARLTTVPVPDVGADVGADDERSGSGELKVAPFALPGVVTVPRHVRARRVEAVMRAEVTPLFAAVTEEFVEALPEGPGPEERAASRWLMAAYAEGADGRRARGAAAGVDPYGLTAVIAVEGALRLVAGDAAPGVLAPAQAFDPADFLQALAPHGVRWSVGGWPAR